MNVLHINTASHMGGAAKVAKRLMEAQRSSGHKARMMVGMKQKDVPGVLRFESKPDPFLSNRYRRQGLLYYEYLGSHDLVDHVEVTESEILHFHNLHGGYFNPFSLPLLTNARPSVWTLHDMQSFTGHCAHSFDCNKWMSGCGECHYLSWYPAVPEDKTALLWKEKKWIYERSNLCIVTPSRWLEEKVKKSILREHPVNLIYNGVDTSLFKPRNKRETRREIGLPEEAFIFGTAANGGIFDNPFKGGKFACEAVRAFTDKATGSIFLNIGCGRKSNQPQTIDLPWVDDEVSFAKILSSLDAFLFTSIAENCPLAVLEALSCGVPVVAFEVGGVPEMIMNGKEGFLAERGKWALLVHGLTYLWNDRRLLNQMARNARKRVLEQFDHRICAAKYEKLYQDRLLKWKSCSGAGNHIETYPEIVVSRPYQSFLSRLKKVITNENNDRSRTSFINAECQRKSASGDNYEGGMRDYLFASGEKIHDQNDRETDTREGFNVEPIAFHGRNRNAAAEYEVVRDELRSEKRREVSISRIEEFLTTCPNSADAYFDLGLLYYELGDKDLALKNFQKAARFEPCNFAFQKKLADFFYVRMDEVDMALEHYARALSSNPADIDTLLILGHLSMSKRKLDEADFFYNEILKIDPMNKDAGQMLAELSEKINGGRP